MPPGIYKHHSNQGFQKGHVGWNKGKKYPQGSKILRELYRSGKKKPVRMVGTENKTWKGDKVGYRAVHDWVDRWKGKPKECEFCGILTAKKYEWANKDHQYNRNLSDYIRLCTRCHRLHDKLI